MNNFNRFEKNVVDLNIKRSKFPLDHGHKTTLCSGRLIPVDCVEVVPGDTFDWSTHTLARLLTPTYPTMDNAYLDLYAFYVPFRLCTKNEKDWPRITGENFDGPWVNSTEYTLANTGNTYDISFCDEASIVNYLGCEIFDSTNFSVVAKKILNAMPLRGLFRIWNEFFRDQNTMSPIDLVDPFTNDIQPEESSQYLAVSKYHDYFTSCSLAPQKANSTVSLLGNYAPVVTIPSTTPVHNSLLYNTSTGMHFSASNASIANDTTAIGINDGVAVSQNTTASTSTTKLTPDNLVADLTATGVNSINDLRFAFGLQSMLERQTFGSRYRESLNNFFGITIPEAFVQVPQYLGGKHIPLSINQVANTANNLGEVGAFSLSCDSAHMFTKSFLERGYIYILACVRTDNTYAYGVPKFLNGEHRNRYFDYYTPLLANLGDMPVYKDEIYADNSSSSVFGYNEAWADYRYIPNKVTGAFSPLSSQANTFKAWTYTETFGSSPSLAPTFIKANKDTLGQTLTDTSTTIQVMCDFEFQVTAVRPMPLFSIPALLGRF